MVWHFIGVYIINRTLHDRLEIRNFSSRVEKYFTRSLRSLVKYFSTLEEKFRISARPCNILYVFSEMTDLFPCCTVVSYLRRTHLNLRVRVAFFTVRALVRIFPRRATRINKGIFKALPLANTRNML